MAADRALEARLTNMEKKRGAIITVLPSIVNRPDLGDQEWHNALFLNNGIDTPDLPTHCDERNTKLSLCHTLD